MDKITIEKVSNGYILSYPDHLDDGTEKMTTILFEEDEHTNEKENLKRLFFFLAEIYGFYYNKWDKENLRIEWDVVGHKVEGGENV